MRYQVFLCALFFPILALSSMRVMQQKFNPTKMLTSQEVIINLDAYMTYINQFSGYVDVSKISIDIENIRKKYPQGTSVQNIINEVLILPCPIRVGNTIVLLENKNEATKRAY